MSKISLINMLIGFAALFFFACFGIFIVNDLTIQQIQYGELMDTWGNLLQKSSHGHGNLFGYLHILMGLTFPYSKFSKKIKILQTLGLFLGTLAMGIGLYIKSFTLPDPDPTLLVLTIGICLGSALLSILIHCLGLLLKIKER